MLTSGGLTTAKPFTSSGLKSFVTFSFPQIITSGNYKSIVFLLLKSLQRLECCISYETFYTITSKFMVPGYFY